MKQCLSFFVGGTWWFPPFSNLRKLLKELEIDLVKQYIDGVAYYEKEPDKPVGEINFHTKQPNSMFRIKGKDYIIKVNLFQLRFVDSWRD